MRRRQSYSLGIIAFVLLAIGLCSVVSLVVWNLLRGEGEVTTPDGTPVADGLVISVLYSPEKEAWFLPLVEAFNERREEVAGQRVVIAAQPMDSGEALEAILNEDQHPIVWSPASTLWVPLLNQRWQDQTGSSEPLAIYPEPLVISPLVIAMWQQYAQAMGYPEHDIGWTEVISATLDPRGWGAYGHSEWGEFLLGHTNPYFSNSGLLSVAAEGYAGAGMVRGLTPEALQQPETVNYIKQIERAIIHYGESTDYFAQQMAARGPSYASAVVLEEQTVVRLNRGDYGALAQPLVAIYPREGTFWSDHPYVVLRWQWLEPEQQAAALLFREYLLSREAQEAALEYGFRPADVSIPVTNSILGAAMGVDPFQPETVLEVPSADTLEALLQTWLDVRKRVNLLLVVDISGSMEGEKLAAVQDGLRLFLNQLVDDDQVAIWAFNDAISVLTPLSPLGPKRDQLNQAIDSLWADRNTILYDVTGEALQEMTRSFDPDRINAVVLMTDGNDTASRRTEASLLHELQRAGAGDQAVRIFTIAYGRDADQDLLWEIADLTGGRMVEGTLENIRRLYVILSSYF